MWHKLIPELLLLCGALAKAIVHMSYLYILFYRKNKKQQISHVSL